MTELRDAFFYTLLEKAKKDKNVILLTADMGAFALKEFAKEVPNQFFNVGIAEQNMVTVAAGLASKGKQVYCYSISSFLVLRAFEQIKIDVCNMKSNVILVGVGGGLEYSYDGSTHHCPNDIGVLRTLPNMKIYVPFDEDTVKWSVEIPGPLYIRLPKGNVENVPKTKIVDGYYMVRDGDAFIITYGMAVHKIFNLLNNMDAKRVGLVVTTMLKPMYDYRTFGPLLRSQGKFMVVEPHISRGGLLSELGEADFWVNNLKGCRYFGYKDEFVDIGGSSDYIERNFGLDYPEIAKQIRKLNDEN